MTIPLPILDLQQSGAEHSFRAFIGWWPDAQTRAWLAEQAQHAQAMYGGRLMQPDHFHLTLAFLDGSRVSDLRTLATQMAQWAVPPIKLDLTIRDVFEKPQVVWAGPDESQTQALAALQQWHDEIWAKLPWAGRSHRVVFALMCPCCAMHGSLPINHIAILCLGSRL